MKYTVEQRLDIGREIYTRQLTIYEAASKYQINLYTARDYMRLFRDKNCLPALNDESNNKVKNNNKNKKVITYDDLESMSKDQLINEVIKARVDAERAKKGYAVKGDGQVKEFISLKNQSLK